MPSKITVCHQVLQTSNYGRHRKSNRWVLWTKIRFDKFIYFTTRRS